MIYYVYRRNRRACRQRRRPRKARDMSSQHRRPFIRSRRILAATAAVAVAGLLAACSGGSSEVNSDYGFAIAEQVADSPITIWADATRQPAVEAFQAAHPEIEVNLVVDDG